MNFKSIITLLVIMMGVSFFFVSCNNDSDLGKDIDGQTYLSLSDNNNWSNLSEVDNQTLVKALKRMEIVKANEGYQTKWTSGSQINISEELFVKIKEVMNLSNKSISNTKLKSVRFKTSAENGTSYDCVAQAISSLLGSFGCSTTYNDVNSWAQAQWGTQGVPLGSFVDACNQFLDGQQISLNGNTFSNGMSPSGQKVIVVMNINGEYHAGVLNYCSGSNLWYHDAYGDHLTDSSTIINAYQACGCE